MDDQRTFHSGLLRKIAESIGWARLRALVEELAREAEKGRIDP